MAKEAVFQTSFVAGELSPYLHDRVDLEPYHAGAAYLRNFIPTPHGPILRRQGTQFLNEAPGFCRLIPFSFDINQSFMLELSHLKLRVYWEDSRILNQAGTAIFEVATPWGLSELPKITYAQWHDYMYICDGIHRPHRIVRQSNNNWVIQPVYFTKTVSGATVDTTPAEWQTNNWPRIVTFFEQRAVYAATPRQPQQIWLSRTGLPEDFTYNDGTNNNQYSADYGSLIILDDHAMTYTIFSTDANGIKWVVPGRSLFVGTAGAEYSVGSTAAGVGITPKNIRIAPHSYHGSAAITPIRAETAIVFVPRSRKRVKTVEYSIEQDQFISQDLTLYSSHILKEKVRDIVVQTAPDTYIWCVTDTGKLIGCTYDRGQKVIAWHVHETAGEIQSIGILPSEDQDMMYLCVKRDKVYSIEILRNLVDPPSNVNDAWYVDSGLKYDGQLAGPGTTCEGTAVIPGTIEDRFCGLKHLEGKEVAILADGWVAPNQVVKNGEVTIPLGAKRVQIGLPYKSVFTSLIPQSSEKLSVGQIRRISEIMVAQEDSLDFWYAASEAKESEFKYTGPTTTMNKAKAPFSGHRKMKVDCGSSLTQQISIWQDRPVPLIIRGVIYYINPSQI